MQKRSKTLPGVTRRQVLSWSTAAIATGVTGVAKAVTLTGTPAWAPFADNPPETFSAEGWLFFTDAEAATVEAIVDRFIPADELSIGGKEAGCAVFIDRQLHGFYGTSARLYREGPFEKGTAMQGDQSEYVPQQRYRLGIAALNNYVQKTAQKDFKDLSPEQQDTLLEGLESGKIKLDGFDGKLFFNAILSNTMEGFFADPIYGGNRDMVSWKMLGFPGARYDYRDYIERHNEDLKFEPIGIADLSQWNKKG